MAFFPNDDQALHELVDGFDWSEVDRRLDAARVLPALRNALERLPAIDGEMLLLVAWEELSPSEAAAALGIPPATARSRLHRARMTLQQDNELLEACAEADR